MAERSAKLITFYSYKGGVGRTFLLANVAALLRRWGAKVLCVDWDLEAPGLHHYLKPEAQPAGPPQGLLPLIADWDAASRAGEAPPIDWAGAVVPGPQIPASPDRGCLHLLLAGEGSGFAARLHGLDWREAWGRGLGDAIERMRSEWLEAYDFVLVDSRTGLSDMAGICTIQLPDVLVLVGTASEQSIVGLRRTLDAAHAGRDRLPYDRGLLLALPVLARFERRVEHQLALDWSARFFEGLSPAFSGWLSAATKPADLASRLQVPHIAYWSFGEGLPVAKEDGNDPESISWSMATIAGLLEHQLVDAHRVIDDRDAFLAESRRRTAGFEVDLLLLAEGGEKHPLAALLRPVLDPSVALTVVETADEQTILGARAVLVAVDGASPPWLRQAADVPGWVFARADERVSLGVYADTGTTIRGPLGSVQALRGDDALLTWLEKNELKRPAPVLPPPVGSAPDFHVYAETHVAFGGWNRGCWLSCTAEGLVLKAPDVRSSGLEGAVIATIPTKMVLRVSAERCFDYTPGCQDELIHRYQVETIDPNGVRVSLSQTIDFHIERGSPGENVVEDPSYESDRFRKVLLDMYGIVVTGL
jgi:Mrp family chromosome partitioning ATPase